jgi:Coenzyme PQQ synthesis protein D (PqqD).
MRYRSIPEALVATLSDGAVLLNLQTKRYFSLNETGTRIWEMVQQTADEETIVEALLDEYDVEEPTARTEVDAYSTSSLRRSSSCPHERRALGVGDFVRAHALGVQRFDATDTACNPRIRGRW